MRLLNPIQLQQLGMESIKNLPAAARAVSMYRTRLEQQFKVPIVMEKLSSGEGMAGTLRCAWNQSNGAKHHSIDLAPCEPWLPPHRLAHELVHLDLESQAHAAGKRKNGSKAPGMYRKLLRRWNSHEHREWCIDELCDKSFQTALDLVVEKTIQRDLPELLPSQQLDLHQWETGSSTAINKIDKVPPKFMRALRSIYGASALYTDQLFAGLTSHFTQYQGLPEGLLAQELCAEIESAFPTLGPGDHYQLVDAFAKIIGFPGLHAWHEPERDRP